MELNVIMLDAIFLLALEAPQKPFVNVITYHLVTLNNSYNLFNIQLNLLLLVITFFDQKFSFTIHLPHT